MTSNHFNRFRNFYPRTEYYRINNSTSCCFYSKCANPRFAISSQGAYWLVGVEEIVDSVWCSYTVHGWQLSLMIHYQVQLSDKSCKNNMRMNPSESAFPGNFCTAPSDTVYSCAMKGEFSSADLLPFVLHEVEHHMCSPLFRCLLFLLSYPNHMDAARVEGQNDTLICSG